MNGFDVLPLLVVGVLTALTLMLIRRRFAPREFHIVTISLIAHIVATFGQLWMILEYYGYGDMIMYNQIGLELSAALQRDFPNTIGPVMRLLIPGENVLGIYVPTVGTSTGNMVTLTGLMLFLLGDSMRAVSLAFALLAWAGKLALYRALKEHFSPHLHWVLITASMLVPSCVFWSAGIIKESVAIAGLGFLTLAASRWITRREIMPLVTASGVLLIGFVKPYIFAPFVLSAAVWSYWARASERGEVVIRPLPLMGAVVLAFAGLMVLGELFPRYSIVAFAEEAADMQMTGTRYRGGSTFTLGDPTERTFFGQLAFVPMAVFTSLYRPSLLDVTNPLVLVNAAETTLLLALTLAALVRHSPGGVWRLLKSSPPLMFCLTFVAVMSVAVGLTTTNLGTLSRYRMPMYPYFVAILGILFFSRAPREVGSRHSMRKTAP